MIAASFGTGQVLWSILWFTMFFIWIWLLIIVFGDIFRSADLSGWGKALWTIFIIVLPFLGILVYLIARGSKMQNRAVEDAKQQDAAFREYVQSTVSDSRTNPADEISRLADLRSQGVLTDAEFEEAKKKALARS
jgi:hypothetical protein